MKSYSVTIQMKATEQYFSMVLFIMLYKLKCFRLDLSQWMKFYIVTIQIKATEPYFAVMLQFIMMYKAVVTFFLTVDEILTCDHSNKN